MLFWSDPPGGLAPGGIVLGRMQLDVPEGRRVGLVAIGIGVAAIVLYVVFSAAACSRS